MASAAAAFFVLPGHTPNPSIEQVQAGVELRTLTTAGHRIVDRIKAGLTELAETGQRSFEGVCDAAEALALPMADELMRVFAE